MEEFELIDPRNGQTVKLGRDHAFSIMSREPNGGWTLKNKGDRAKLGLPSIQEDAINRGDKKNTGKTPEQGNDSGGG